ncbi:unnamed protein product, partial [Vitis vinifera]
MTDHRVELVIPLRVLRPQDHENVGLDSKNDFFDSFISKEKMAVVEAFLSSLFEVVLDKLVATPLLDYARRIKVDTAVLQEWMNTLLHLQAVLHDAEQRQIREEAVKRWVDDLKALAYDIEDVLDEKSDLHLTQSVGGVSAVTEQRLTTSLIDKAEFYGRDGDKEKIMELLLSDEIASADKVQVIPIVGMGGVGKTTLAQMIYNDERVGDNFDIRVWVFFLVLDDIWKEDPNSWSTLQAPFRNGAQGSVVMVTTRIAFENVTPDARQNLEPIGRKIIKKCDGLPLAANTLAGLLRFTITSLQNLKGGETMEDVGEICFQNLLSRSFFQQSGHNKSMFVMHDLIHDLAQFLFDMSKKFDPLRDKVLHDVLPKFRCMRVLSLSDYNITYLPDSFGNLKHLRYLNLSGTKIQKLPKSIGMLLNLQSLVLSGCFRLTELPAEIGKLINLHHLDISRTKIEGMPMGINGLKDLAHLQGALSILNLQNVVPTDDIEVNLMKKEDLDDLVFAWDPNAIVRVSEIQTKVLEKLQPHNKVKRLSIECFYGIKFPKWLEDPSFMNLSLKDLCIVKMANVRKLKKDLPKHLPKLTKLEIRECQELEIPPILHSLTSLKKLNIEDCESLASFPEMALPPMLERLRICSCPILESLPEMQNNTTLQHLSIDYCDSLRSLPRDIDSLKTLSICRCKKLELALQEDMTHNHYASLTELTIWGTGLPTPNLRLLLIRNCEKLKSLPQGMHTLLTSLQFLHISSCPEIDSFPEGGLPTNLSKLSIIGNCSKLVANQMEWGLQTLPFLRTLAIGFQHLTSLETLEIWKCGNLKNGAKGIKGKNGPTFLTSPA